MQDSSKLRELASWYREFAERTANPMIWEARLHTAEDLEAEANLLDRCGDRRTASDRPTRRETTYMLG
ncbi:MAG: hypothetical protein AB7H90_19875 [Alphaproteobacteria bacterium]